MTERERESHQLILEYKDDDSLVEKEFFSCVDTDVGPLLRFKMIPLDVTLFLGVLIQSRAKVNIKTIFYSQF